MRRFVAFLLLFGSSALAFANESFPGGFSVSVGFNHSSVDTVTFAGRPLRDSWSGLHTRVSFEGPLFDWTGAQVGWMGFGSETGQERMGVGCPGSCPPGHPGFVISDVRYRGSAWWAAFTPGIRDGGGEIAAKLGVAYVSRSHRSSHTEHDWTAVIGVTVARYGPSGWGARFDLERLGSLGTAVGIGATYRFGGAAR